MDVPMQRKRGLEPLDRLTYRGRTGRLHRESRILQIHLRRELRRIVEPRAVRRAVQAEDHPLRRVRPLLAHPPDPLGELRLVLLTVGIPRRSVGPTAGCHLVAVELEHASLPQLHRLRLRDHVIDLELVVITGADDTPEAWARETLVRKLHPAMHSREHVLLK